MVTIRKFLLLTIVVFLFAGCSSTPDEQYEELPTELIKENANDAPPVIVEEPQPPEELLIFDDGIGGNEVIVVHPGQESFTSKWARTPAHFFMTRGERIFRVPLDDIAQGVAISVPGYGEIEIVGLCQRYLYVSRLSGEWDTRHYEIYRISFATLQATLIDSGMYLGVPRFHAPSNSILFAHGDSYDGAVWLEYLHLDTGARRIFYEFDSNNFDTVGNGWMQVKNGSTLFINSSWGAAEQGSDFILINPEFYADRIQFYDIEWWFSNPPQPQNPAEEFIFELQPGIWHTHYATAGEWVYYLLHDRENWIRENWSRNLYRISIDGTQNTLLQENTGVSSLLSVNDLLFALMFAKPGEDSDIYKVAKLSADGSVVKVLGYGLHGHNSAFGMQRLADTDFIKIIEVNFFWLDAWVQGLYCTNTGVLFSLTMPQD